MKGIQVIECRISNYLNYLNNYYYSAQKVKNLFQIAHKSKSLIRWIACGFLVVGNLTNQNDSIAILLIEVLCSNFCYASLMIYFFYWFK